MHNIVQVFERKADVSLFWLWCCFPPVFFRSWCCFSPVFWNHVRPSHVRSFEADREERARETVWRVAMVGGLMVLWSRTTSCGSWAVCVKQGGGDRTAMSNVTVCVRFRPMNAREAQVESGAPCIRRFNDACVLFKVNIAPLLHRLLSCWEIIVRNCSCYT
jgi:hypothetical protein